MITITIALVLSAALLGWSWLLHKSGPYNQDWAEWLWWLLLFATGGTWMTWVYDQISSSMASTTLVWLALLTLGT